MGLGVTELIFIIAIALLLFGPAAIVGWIAFTLGKSQAGEPAAEHGDTALGAARERYARGEINREEFDEIKSTLGY